MSVGIDWAGYLRVHSERRNLVIHLIAVPLFVVATAALVLSLLRGKAMGAAVAIAGAVIAMMAQGGGHAFEAQAPEPFSGPGNFLKRWFLEQFLIFPAFLVTGRWWQQFRTSGGRAGDAA